MPSKIKWCEVTTMCGFNLHHGVLFVGTITTLTSIITLANAVVCVVAVPGEKGFNGQPVMAIDMIFGLYSTSVSFYQIVISLLLIWRTMRTKGDILLCTLWHVSHISIITFYCLLFAAKTTACFIAKEYFKAWTTAVAGLLYNAVFIYFSIVVNSFSYTIDEDIYY